MTMCRFKTSSEIVWFVE